MAMLEVKDLHVSVEGKEILKGVNLTVEKGQIHALMGPNGSGKSTLSNVIMGHPKYKVTKGEIIYKGKNIMELKPYERAKLGMFLAFQYPMEVQGVGLSHFLFTLFRQKLGTDKPSHQMLMEFKKDLTEKMQLLKLDKSFAERSVNVGLSGGEKKRAEVLQMLMAKPELAVLDETDSGLDIDSLKVVANGINTLRGPDFSALLITHYQRILSHLTPDVIHVLHDGRIIKTGGAELAHELEKKGYGWLIEKAQKKTEVAA